MNALFQITFRNLLGGGSLVLLALSHANAATVFNEDFADISDWQHLGGVVWTQQSYTETVFHDVVGTIDGAAATNRTNPGVMFDANLAGPGTLDLDLVWRSMSSGTNQAFSYTLQDNASTTPGYLSSVRHFVRQDGTFEFRVRDDAGTLIASADVASQSWPFSPPDGFITINTHRDASGVWTVTRSDTGVILSVAESTVATGFDFNTLEIVEAADTAGASENRRVDNVSLDITAVPEPASAALIGLGLCGLISRRIIGRL